MQTIPASEIKRRGISVIEEKLLNGPVHIVKHNHLACVILSEEQYQQLTSHERTKPKLTLADLLNKPATGTKTKNQITKRLRHERNVWDENK